MGGAASGAVGVKFVDKYLWDSFSILAGAVNHRRVFD